MLSVYASNRPSWWLAAAVAVIGLSLSAAAKAADSGGSSDDGRKVAQALFESARELMQAGQFTQACPKLKKSVELEDAPGTRLNLAWCHEQLGQTASAWVNYQDALALAVQRDDAERQTLARDSLAALAPKLSRIKVTLRGVRPSGTWLMVDGLALGGESFDTSFPIDPGEHRLRAGAPGWLDQEMTVMVQPGDALEQVELPALQRAPVKTKQAPAPWLNERRRFVLMGSTLGVGVAGLVGTGVFGWQAKRSWDERNAACSGGCDERAVAAGDKAKSFAWAANVSLGVGLLGVGLGAYVLWSAPGDSAVAVGVTAEGSAPLLTASGKL